MEARANLRGIFLTAVLCALALAFAACGGRKQPSVPPSQKPGRASVSPQSSDRSGGLQTADSLENALTELDALKTPEGVDPALFAELKDALEEALICRYSIGMSRVRELVGGTGVSR